MHLSILKFRSHPPPPLRHHPHHRHRIIINLLLIPRRRKARNMVCIPLITYFHAYITVPCHLTHIPTTTPTIPNTFSNPSHPPYTTPFLLSPTLHHPLIHPLGRQCAASIQPTASTQPQRTQSVPGYQRKCTVNLREPERMAR